MKVCVIDDDALVLEHIAGELADLGHDVLTAADADAGMRLIEQERPDAVVVDILMPDRDGLTLIMEARPYRDQMRIVAITGGGMLGATPVLQMASGLGAHAVLVKPFTAEALQRALQPA